MSSTPSEIPAQPIKRRDDRRERTRERLLTTAIDLLRREGLGALNVSRVAKDVGVHPSLFYAHFKNLDACVAAAAERVLQTLAPVDRELRRELFKRTITDRRELARYFAGALDRWLEQRPFIELLLAHRLDRSPMGEVLRPALASIADDLTAELWDLAAQFGLDGKHIREAKALADLHLSNWLWALEMLIEGRAHDRDALAATLGRIFLTNNIAFFEHALAPSRAELVASSFTPEQKQALIEQRALMRKMVERADDARWLERGGGLAKIVDGMFAALGGYFMPQATRGANAVVRYRIVCGEERVERYLIVRDQKLSVQNEAPDEQARLTLTMPLRIFLETISGIRTFDGAYRARDIQLEGDMFFAVDLVDWFFIPET